MSAPNTPGSVFSYNGLYIGPSSGKSVTGVDVMQYSAVAEYDETQSNIQWKKYTLRVRGLVQGDPGAIERQLMVPRAPLYFQLAGGSNSPYSQADLPAGDDRTGPIPGDINMTPMVGSNLVLVDFSISWFLQNACTNGESDVLAFNYSYITSMDEQFLSTISIEGSFKMRFAGGANNPDLYRQLAFFPLINGFRRQRVSFAVNPNGLDMNFGIVDTEMPSATLPKPIVEGGASFAVSMDQYVWYNTFQGRGKTHNFATKLEVFSQLVAMAKSRMDFSTEIIISGSITENLYDNECGLNITTMVTSLTGGENGFYPKSTKLFLDVPSSGEQEYVGPYGTAMVAAAKILWYDPCLGPQQNNAATGAQSYSAPTLTITTQNPSNQSPSGGGQSSLNQNAANPYLAYSDTYEWEMVSNAVILPAAAQGGGVSVYQIGDPYIITRRRGHAAMAKKQPTFPSARLTKNSKSIILRNKLTTLAPELAPDHSTIEFGIMWDIAAVTTLSPSQLTQGAPYESPSTQVQIQSPTNPMINSTPKPYAMPADSTVGGS